MLNNIKKSKSSKYKKWNLKFNNKLLLIMNLFLNIVVKELKFSSKIITKQLYTNKPYKDLDFYSKNNHLCLTSLDRGGVRNLL